jgi:hypothetical protein
MPAIPAVCTVLACALSGAALAVSLMHVGPAGPRGPQGPAGSQGNAGKAAHTARLGICWNQVTSPQLSGLGYTAVEYVSIDQATYADGVYACPQGDSFVSIVPQPSQSGG